MNPKQNFQLLSVILKQKGKVEITVSGISMFPTLVDGDLITIIPYPEYFPGDILVYTYRNEGLLVHRLLQKKNLYYCKGDNAFRTEHIPQNRILGKVTMVNNIPLTQWQQWQIDLSYTVGQIFIRCHYDPIITMQSDIYKLYSAIIFRKEDKHMNYIKNPNMDFILTDETSLAVFDPDSESTYFFDEIGIDILNQLTHACNINTLLTKLCAIYDVSPGIIRNDVEEFLAYTVTKKIVNIITEEQI